MKVEAQQLQSDDGGFASTGFSNVVFGIFGFCATGAEGDATNGCWKAPGVGYNIGGLYPKGYLPSSPYEWR